MRGFVWSSVRRVVDVAVPLLVALLWLAVAYEASSLGQHETPATLLGAAFGMVQGAALWWRRSRPVLVMGITLAGGLVTLLLYPEQVFPYAPLVAIGSVAAARPPRVSLAALAGLLALTALNYLTGSESAEDVTFVMMFPIAIWSMGEAVRNRRAAIEAALRRAVSDEQARISRELHDVIARNVSVIVVQAAAAHDVFDERPDQARVALRAIEATGRDAFRELRRVLAAVSPGAPAEGNTADVGGNRLTTLRRLGDAAIPVLMSLLLVAIALDASDRGLRDTPLTVVGLVAGVTSGAALWWRRRQPILVMAITLAGGVVTHQIYPAEIFPYAALVAMGALAAAQPPRVSLVALAALLAVTSLDFLHASDDDAWFAMVLAVVAWSLGEATRTRRIAIEQASRRAVSEEQARIARELHDVIAHSVSVIVVQAAAADDVFDERPDHARAAVRAIEATGRESLAELRRVLGAVRPVGEPAEAAPATPHPGLDRLGELVEPLRAAGLQVDVRCDDLRAAVPVPGDVDLSAYRIVQEALTNTLRHAQASHAQVRVRSEAEFLDLDVIDDGRGAGASPGGGRGIPGMRERAAMLGGTLEAGPLPGGGFRVHARLPLESVR